MSTENKLIIEQTKDKSGNLVIQSNYQTLLSTIENISKQTDLLLTDGEAGRKTLTEHKSSIIQIEKDLMERYTFMKKAIHKHIEPALLQLDEINNQLMIPLRESKSKLQATISKSLDLEKEILREYATDMFAQTIAIYPKHDLTWIQFQDMGLSITTATTKAKIRKTITAYFEKITEDLDAIQLEDPSLQPEIMLAFKVNRSFITSKKEVIARHELIKQQQEQQRILEEKRALERKKQERIQAEQQRQNTVVMPSVAPAQPVPVQPVEPPISIKLEFIGKQDDIKALLSFAKSRNIEIKDI